MSFRRPIGVAGLITPFNFPLAIPTWKMFPALLCGNAVIFKPAEDVPHTAHLLVEILLEAGLPPEVVKLVHGEGPAVAKAMVDHPERSEEKTPELKSRVDFECRLLLEKKNTKGQKEVSVIQIRHGD